MTGNTAAPSCEVVRDERYRGQIGSWLVRCMDEVIHVGYGEFEWQCEPKLSLPPQELEAAESIFDKADQCCCKIPLVGRWLGGMD